MNFYGVCVFVDEDFGFTIDDVKTKLSNLNSPVFGLIEEVANGRVNLHVESDDIAIENHVIGDDISGKSLRFIFAISYTNQPQSIFGFTGTLTNIPGKIDGSYIINLENVKMLKIS
jgi:hypothetical protein